MSKIYTSFITLKNGKRIYARSYGKKSFVFDADPNYEKRKKVTQDTIDVIKELSEDQESQESL